MATKPLTDVEATLAAALLDLASEQLSRNGCNDFVLSDHVAITTGEARELDLAMHKWNGDPEEHDPSGNHDWQADDFLAAYLAARLRGEV